MRSAIVAMFVIGLTLAADSQTTDCRRFDVVRATLNQTVPVNGLKQENLSLALGPEHKNFKEWELVPTPAQQRFLVLVDGTALKDGETSSPVLQVLDDLVQHAKPSSQLAVNTFGHSLEGAIEFNHSRAELGSYVQQLRANASTMKLGKNVSIRDTLMKAAAAFDKPHLGDTVFLITRGPEAGNEATVARVTHELQQRGIRLFVIYFMWYPINSVGVITDRFRPDRNDPQGLLNIAADTGGAVYPLIPDMASTRYNLIGEKLMKFRGAAGSFYNSMTQFYIVASKNPVPEQEVRIQAVVPNSPIASGMTLDYARRIAACVPTD